MERFCSRQKLTSLRMLTLGASPTEIKGLIRGVKAVRERCRRMKTRCANADRHGSSHHAARAGP